MSIVGGNALSSLQANKERTEWLPPGFFKFQNLAYQLHFINLVSFEKILQLAV